MRDYCTGGNALADERDCVENSTHLFFPVYDLNYRRRLNQLNSRQVRLRIYVFYDIWRRRN
jgi:hypothetical protein